MDYYHTRLEEVEVCYEEMRKSRGYWWELDGLLKEFLEGGDRRGNDRYS